MKQKPARRKAALPRALPLPPEWRLRRRGGVAVLEALPLAQIPWLVHGFSTRVGGTSLQDGNRMLNLGYVEWDERSRVAENRRRFVRALGASEMEFVALRQFHSSLVRIFRCGPAQHLKGDAHLTRARGLLLTVQTADCVPILLVDTRKRIIAAIHAGWRGTAARVAQKIVGDLRMYFGTRPEDVIAAIGPAIGGCCYEVGPNVAHEFGSQFAQAGEWFEGPFAALSTGDEPTPFLWLQFDPPGHDRPKRVLLDLPAANRWQLEAAGVLPDRIFSCGVCTSCRMDWLFSYRREGLRTGRLMSAIGMKKVVASD
ncbi:MAG: peptidoglycan editing factor PgeF [Acidobacteriota bacterium]|nr:peptidoglycan editing factor PgeF [Acidobacteriota bacterium]